MLFIIITQTGVATLAAGPSVSIGDKIIYSIVGIVFHPCKSEEKKLVMAVQCQRKTLFMSLYMNDISLHFWKKINKNDYP